MRNKDLLKRRNKLIYEKYCELWQSGQREELIWPQISVEFHLEESTIYRIVLALVKESQKVQKQMNFNKEESDNATE